MIKVIVCTYTSERDINGNCYHFARFYNTSKSRQESVVMEVGAYSNALHIAHGLADGDWEKTLSFETVLPKRKWKRSRDFAMNCSKITGLHEGSDETKAALKALFSPFNLEDRLATVGRDSLPDDDSVECANR